MMRVGLGYDIHRLKLGRRLVLGGVEIPFMEGLEGHSDADVVVHAVIDALLGAAGLGDIGGHFPTSDPSFKDVSSVELLHQVVGIVHTAGYRIGNVDAMVVAERPRLAPYVAEMRSALAHVLRVTEEAVSVKATTNEGLGSEGRGEGISAQAVALLERVE
jgi:2-C-methyl-D-erythritol 2,4-cyclodiphosphate synthase